MHAVTADIIDRMEKLHSEIIATLEGLPSEALDWVPGPEMNSLAVLAAHVAEAEHYWIGEIAGGDDAHRTRSDEFETQGLTAEQLIEQLNAAQAHNRRVLEALTLEDLAIQRPHAKRGQVRVSWALLHALEHTGLHTGHMQITRQLWDQHS